MNPGNIFGACKCEIRLISPDVWGKWSVLGYVLSSTSSSVHQDSERDSVSLNNHLQKRDRQTDSVETMHHRKAAQFNRSMHLYA